MSVFRFFEVVDFWSPKWWRIKSSEDHEVGARFDSHSIEVPNGSVLFTGRFRELDPNPSSSNETGEGVHGRIDQIDFFDSDGARLAIYEDVDRDIGVLTDLYNETDRVDGDFLDRVFAHIDRHQTAVVLTDGSERLKGEDLTDTAGLPIHAGPGDDRLLFTAGSESNIVLGDAGDDTIRGGRGKDDISGGTGDDDLRGDGGADKLNGDAGSDTLKGGAGRDRIEGGGGRDHLWGDGGPDRFVLADGGRRDVVHDFTDGADLVLVTAGDAESFEDLTLRQKAAGVLVKEGAAALMLLDAQKADLGADDFLFA